MKQKDRINEDIVGVSSLKEGSMVEAMERPETPKERYRKMGKAKMTEATLKNYPPSGRRREQSTPPTTRYAGTHHRHMKSPLGQSAAVRPEEGRQRISQANTPWHMWTASEGAVSEVQTSQATLTATLDETRKVKINNEIRRRDHTDFGRKAWRQVDSMSNTWVTTCPKEHIALNAKQFPVVAKTYFGVR